MLHLTTSDSWLELKLKVTTVGIHLILQQS